MVATYCGEHFTKHIIVESLHFTPESNIIILYINSIAIKKSKNKQKNKSSK